MTARTLTLAKDVSSPDAGQRVATDVSTVVATLERYRFTAANEAELQQQIADVFERQAIPFEREVHLGEAGRVDFVVDRHIGLEVKVKGGLASVLRQLFRYAEVEALDCLVLVTARVQLTSLRGTLWAKPVHVVHVTGGLL